MIRRSTSAALAVLLAVAGFALLVDPPTTSGPGPRHAHPAAIDAALSAVGSPVAYRSADPSDERWANRTDSSRLPLLALLCLALLVASAAWFGRTREASATWTAFARTRGLSARAPPVAH